MNSLPIVTFSIFDASNLASISPFSPFSKSVVVIASVGVCFDSQNCANAANTTTIRIIQKIWLPADFSERPLFGPEVEGFGFVPDELLSGVGMTELYVQLAGRSTPFGPA